MQGPIPVPTPGGGASLSSAAPQAVGTAAAGVSTDASRADHVHAHGNQASDGNMHAAAVAGGAAGFMTGADKTKLDGLPTSALSTTGGTLTGNLLFTDATYSIGASGANRPASLFLSSTLNIASGLGLSLSTGGGYAQYQILNAGSVHYHLFNSSSSASSGARPYFKITPSNNTGQTAGTEVNGFSFDAHSRTWAGSAGAGGIATQREFFVGAPTFAFAAANTITNAFNGYFADPVAGTNATLTNKWSLGTEGAAQIGGKLNVVGDLDHDGTNVGFYGTAPTSKQTVTGSRGANAALASLLTALAAIGLITDSSSA